eukprot:CAMPEP_0196598762 /NCGR_PEP_ID=MMETSP1081-20130531/94494_1 /TAXON_ID=36882 /ORGANISM="Pyramimonas amylifera, Strain CCMP720" /LENGTH=147 /DNA_ID=CAMNT_0041924481 /DNA_START=455 /DNA_END=898 /DNA_ORIENTATION=-
MKPDPAHEDGEEDAGPSRRRHFQDDEINGMAEIPDLDGGFDDEEDFQRQVAAPPKQRQPRVQSLKELDSTVQYTLPQSKDDFDLSLLISALVPVDKVREDDVHWEPDALLSEVAFEIQTEKEQLEEKEEEGGEGTEKNANEQSLFAV